MNWVLARLSEASTWAGFGIIAAAIGQAFPDAAPVAHGAAVICGGLAAVVAEKGGAGVAAAGTAARSAARALAPLLLTAALGGALCACTTSQLTSSAQQLQQVCQAGAPVIQAATAKTATNATATNLLGYAAGVCNAAGAVVTANDPTGTPVDPAWLENVLSALQVAAEVAPVVLPLL